MKSMLFAVIFTSLFGAAPAFAGPGFIEMIFGCTNAQYPQYLYTMSIVVSDTGDVKINSWREVGSLGTAQVCKEVSDRLNSRGSRNN